MNELYIPPERPTRNLVTGRFLKGIPPHNKGKSMKYHSNEARQRSLINLAKGSGGNHKNGAGENRRSVVAIKSGKFCGVFHSILEASRLTGINASLIGRICRKKPGKHTAGGFQWFFENDNTWYDLIIR